MATKKINLDSMVSKCVHRPIVKGDADMTPLYKRNDGIFDTFNGKSTRSEQWVQAAETTYSSPNNIKRVFITYEGVYLHYFRPVAGDKSGVLSKFYSYKSVDPDIDLHEALKSKRMNNREIVVTKLGIGAIKRPWSCSNIEEIYFDWSVLLSDDIQNFGYADLIQKMTIKGTTVINNGRLLWDLFSRVCLNPGEKVSNTFPRLKIIGYMDNLKEVYDRIGKPRESIEATGKLWFNADGMGRVVADPNTFICAYKIPNVSTYNTKFVTRSYYSLDEMVLAPYFSKVSLDITNMIRAKQGTLVKATGENEASKVEVEQVVKSDYEKALDESFTVVGESGIYMSLKMMLNNLGKDKWLQLFRDMSEGGREKYKEIYSRKSRGGDA